VAQRQAVAVGHDCRHGTEMSTSGWAGRPSGLRRGTAGDQDNGKEPDEQASDRPARVDPIRRRSQALALAFRRILINIQIAMTPRGMSRENRESWSK